MKLSTLLLSSAALVVAGSAYAADLPAKKGAPAAKPATGCPAFGAGYFQIPGGDTCIKFSGYAAYEGSYDATASSYSQSGDARLIVDTASNTDLGALKSRFRFNGSTSTGSTAAASSSVGVSRAWASLGGFKFGKDDSHADIGGVGAGGTYAWNYSGGLGGGTGTGIWYALPMGGATVELGEETAVTDATPNLSNRPDVMLKASVPAGPAAITVMGISHAPKDATTGAMGNGYAFLGNVSFNQGGIGAAVFGGISQGAMAYTGGASNGVDSTAGGTYSKGSNVGAELTAGVGGGTLAVVAQQYVATPAGAGTTTVNQFDVEYDINVAKGLVVAPEVWIKTGSTTDQAYYLTIRRDF